MNCPSCGSDKIDGYKSRHLMRDATRYKLRCKECNYCFSKIKNTRDFDKSEFYNVVMHETYDDERI